MSDSHNGESLSEVHASVAISRQPGFWRRLWSFMGPAYLIAVGYMDPGNWATDIAGGSQFGYALLWVLLMSNLMALLLQSLSARLGIVTRRDLAQACRESYPRGINIVLWLMAEVAIAATDLAEVLGSAIALKLLFGLPLVWGTILTALDTFLILFLHQLGIRKMEAFIVALIALIGGSLSVEILLSGPDLAGIAGGFVPSLPGPGALFVAMGILGATVMPHNLYLHSALVQSRRIEKSDRGIFQAIKFNMVDSLVALNGAFLVNAAILIMSAAIFFQSGHVLVADIQEAHKLLEPIVGSGLAPILFAVALLAAGQSSTITGTLTGQIVMEGFVNIRLRPWVRRLITRLLAVIPAVIVLSSVGESATGYLLVLSQVILSLQLAFAVVPLIHFVSDRGRMGRFAIPNWTKVLAWGVALIVAVLNGKLVIDQITEWLRLGGWIRILVGGFIVPLVGVVGSLLVYIVIRPWVGSGFSKRPIDPRTQVHGAIREPVLEVAAPFERIAVGVDFSGGDEHTLSHAMALSIPGSGVLILLHVVESAGAITLGDDIGDRETIADYQRLLAYAEAVRKAGYKAEIEMGFGAPIAALAKLVESTRAELLVVGTHGHEGTQDLMRGSVSAGIRHKVRIPVLIVQ